MSKSTNTIHGHHEGCGKCVLLTWVDTNDEWPDLSTFVLMALSDGGEVREGYFDGEFWYYGNADVVGPEVSYWAPMPALPAKR